MSIQRYNVYDKFLDIYQNDHGEFVKYDDHIAEVQRLSDNPDQLYIDDDAGEKIMPVYTGPQVLKMTDEIETLKEEIRRIHGAVIRMNCCIIEVDGVYHVKDMSHLPLIPYSCPPNPQDQRAGASPAPMNPVVGRNNFPEYLEGG